MSNIFEQGDIVKITFTDDSQMICFYVREEGNDVVVQDWERVEFNVARSLISNIELNKKGKDWVIGDY